MCKQVNKQIKPKQIEKELSLVRICKSSFPTASKITKQFNANMHTRVHQKYTWSITFFWGTLPEIVHFHEKWRSAKFQHEIWPVNPRYNGPFWQTSHFQGRVGNTYSIAIPFPGQVSVRSKFVFKLSTLSYSIAKAILSNFDKKITSFCRLVWKFYLRLLPEVANNSLIFEKLQI